MAACQDIPATINQRTYKQATNSLRLMLKALTSKATLSAIGQLTASDAYVALSSNYACKDVL
eukprot:5995566-Amphidinium_carterae.1